MHRPRTPGAGITRAATKSLAGERLHPTETGSETQRQHVAATRHERGVGQHPFWDRLAQGTLRHSACTEMGKSDLIDRLVSICPDPASVL
jgi:hypothetical protein